MKNVLAIIFASFIFTACGSGDTGDGYEANREGLNPNSGLLDSNVSPAAGSRGNPDSSPGVLPGPDTTAAGTDTSGGDNDTGRTNINRSGR